MALIGCLRLCSQAHVSMARHIRRFRAYPGMQAKDFRKYLTCIDACMLNHLHAGNRTNSETQSTHVVSQATTGCATKQTVYFLLSHARNQLPRHRSSGSSRRTSGSHERNFQTASAPLSAHHRRWIQTMLRLWRLNLGRGRKLYASSSLRPT
jgi:hypothetical protein